MIYDQGYFENRNYQQKEQLIKRHVLAVLRWASQALHENLLNGVGKTALDLGCALGYTTRTLAELGYVTVGTDISRWGICTAKNQGKVNFLVCDAQASLPFSTGVFDLVTCFDVLEHLLQPERALLGMFEACRGVVVCTTPNRKVEKPIRILMRDYDQTHISARTPLQWHRCVESVVKPAALNVESFYDLPVRLGNKLFFKSFNIPTYGLTVRIAIKK